MFDFSPEYFMGEALKEAQKAFDADEVPVGAVIVAGNKIIARAYNLTERLTDVTAHAEMQAITMAASSIGGKYLQECSIYVTLEPCVMCGGALGWSQISEIYFGAYDLRKGISNFNKNHSPNILHPKTKIMGGLLEKPCEEILNRFFMLKRK
jgi:tRNA(adenine34) deaminase